MQRVSNQTSKAPGLGKSAKVAFNMARKGCCGTHMPMCWMRYWKGCSAFTLDVRLKLICAVVDRTKKELTLGSYLSPLYNLLN